VRVRRQSAVNLPSISIADQTCVSAVNRVVSTVNRVSAVNPRVRVRCQSLSIRLSIALDFAELFDNAAGEKAREILRKNGAANGVGFHEDEVPDGWTMFAEVPDIDEDKNN
jgi:hypothetical protein